MSGDRLTRQELSWLLAQEARSAATALRQGVSGLTLAPAPGPGNDDVTSSLDALDDAMRALSSLNSTAPGSHPGRKGRIDLASLVVELAPNTRVAIAPGSGTEVYGDETEIRRMLQVLLNFAATAPRPSTPEEVTSQASIRREGDEVRVVVALGPDSSATGALEQAWLHRMAVRCGGALFLEGGHVTLAMPADVPATDRLEVEELRRELAAAQDQSEAYARELAMLFTQRYAAAPPISTRLSRPVRTEIDTFGTVARLLAALARRESRAAERVAALGQLARHLGYESPSAVELRSLAEGAIGSLRAKADAKRVVIAIEAPVSAGVARQQGVASLLRLLVDQAISAAPEASHVLLSLRAEREGIWAEVRDQGPALPAGARDAMQRLAADTQARPGDVELFVADALARHLGGYLEIDQTAPGVVIQAFLPAVGPLD